MAETDIVEQARQHVASFEAIGGTVAYPFSVRLSKRVVSQAAEIERLRAACEAMREVAEQLEELVECAERDLRMNRDEEDGGYWSLRTANCFEPARAALARYRAIAAWNRRATPSGWRTMESAPKDGTPAMLFTPAGEDINCKGGLIWVSGGWGKAAINPESWRGESSHGTPTHWRPLPPPPAEEDGK